MKISIQVLIIASLTVLLSACSPSDSQKEAAYEAGWNSIFNERCRGIAQPMMIPSKYDDSNGSGELVNYYRSGIADAESDPNLCK
jgi:hypothetical protein|tara:strand:+ start:32 stop:286 length:255 start_codon:yes stop_codon:yes gene_type:complete